MGQKYCSLPCEMYCISVGSMIILYVVQIYINIFGFASLIFLLKIINIIIL